MLSNYLKLAWRILGRRKFFSAITLFGISFTLGILMVIISFLHSELGTNKPLTHKDDLVVLSTLSLERKIIDTIMVIDTIAEASGPLYDTTYDYKRSGTWIWNSDMNNLVVQDHLSDLPTMQNYTLINAGIQIDAYLNNAKITIKGMHTDHRYFEIFDQILLEGRFLEEDDIQNAAHVAVIGDEMAEKYFSRKRKIVGEVIPIDGRNLEIVGVIKSIKKAVKYIGPDLIMPYTLQDEDKQSSYYHGNFETIFRKKANVSLESAKEDVRQAANTIPLDHPSKPEHYNEVVLKPQTYNERFAYGIYPDEDASKSYRILKWALLSLLSLFIFLPILNLINLNVSRILDRSSEIGVRKAFGAHQSNIMLQFIIENLVQTILGGLIGLALALGLIHLLNNSGSLGDIHLMVSPTFFIYALLITIVFGILSGLIPAYRMSRLHIVNALKSKRL